MFDQHISWILCMFGIGFLVATCARGADHPELKAFPAAKEGMERFVIVLPHKERGAEDDFKVELVPGKTMLTDGVNLTQVGMKIEPRPLEGWGYTYYEVTGRGLAMSTMMAVPPGTPQVEKFVSGTPLLIRYNSRLPVVIYAPRGYEIRYRIWQAPKDSTAAEPG
jgi:ecotin